MGHNWSKVISIVDGGSSVSFTIGRTQDGGIGKGNLEGKMTGELFDVKSNVVKGDKIFTSGLGGAFTPGLYVGEVTKVVKRSDNLLVDIEITPAVDFGKVRDVFVIKQN